MNTEENDVPEELSMRDEMEAAVTDVEEIIDNEEVETASKDEYVEKTPEVEAPEAKAATNGDTPPAAAAPTATKSPQSWSPGLREKFAGLDPAIQQQIHKRETEIARSLNDGANNRKLGEGFTQLMSPYQSLFAAEGVRDPMQAVSGLMETAAALSMGNPQQKAQRLAQLINHYNVDITELDSVLSGQPSANPQSSQLDQMLNEKLAPIQQFMGNMQQNQQQQQQQQGQRVQQEVQQFSQNAEFINDVRNDMADLMDMAAKRGQKMTLQQAYDKSVQIHPEISQVIADRQKNDRIMGNNNSIAQKRQASSSISGHKSGGGGGNKGGSIFDTLNDAWDNSMRG
jgi:hypothetical protein